MILKFIFRSVSITGIHTGVAAVIATAMGSENPAAVGFTSLAVGIPALLVGAYVGDELTYKPSPDKHCTEQEEGNGARIGGLICYAAGSVLGFALKHS